MESLCSYYDDEEVGRALWIEVYATVHQYYSTPGQMIQHTGHKLIGETTGLPHLTRDDACRNWMRAAR